MADVCVSRTLEQAIRDKYCLQEEPVEEQLVGNTGEDEIARRKIDERALDFRPGNCPVERLRSIVLDSKGVYQAGEVRDLCPRVEELHISSNHITHYTDVSKILASFPKLKLLNLGHNPLDSSTFQPNGNVFDCLSTLVLSGTCLDWAAVEALLKGIPQLQELHLSVNNYMTVGFTESFLHPKLRLLHINENKISLWAELVKLSHAFPNLQTLIASSNPIQDIPHINSETFPQLQTLNLNSSALSSWQSIESLHALCRLKELSVMKTPLGSEMEEKIRRFAIIARLPKMEKLNKSLVTESERDAAERWLIRQLKDSPNPPPVYHVLVKKHGELYPLAEVNMKKGSMVRLKFYFDEEERSEEEHRINVSKMTVLDLKKWVAETLIGMSTSSFHLCFYDWTGTMEMMRYHKKYLYTYRLEDGDAIYIRMKRS